MEEIKKIVIEISGETSTVTTAEYTTKKEFASAIKALIDYYNSHKQNLS